MSIKSYKSPKTEVRESKVGGKGLFAKEDIKKGEVIFIKSGQILSLEETQKYNKKFGSYYSLQISDEFCLCPTSEEEVKDTVLFINHSCNPNVGIDGQISFVALRDIKKGEELCHDYATTLTHDFKLKCNCGSKNCRKIITGNDWKLKELQDRYKNHFAWFILKKIKSIG